MFLLNWYKQWLDIRTEFRQKRAEVVVEETICKSCETLRAQLDIANYEKEKLLNRLLEKPEVIQETEAPKITIPKAMPWNMRKQILEREDREKARLLRDAPKPNSDIADVEQLEKDLDVATAQRESNTGT